MIRLLHVHSGNLFGGVETMLLAMTRHRDLCPELEASFALCFTGRLANELTAAGAHIYELGEVQIRRFDSIWRARRRLAALLGAQRFNAVVTHSAWSHAIFGSVVRAAGLPLITFLHGAANGKHWLDRLARRTPPDLVICNSRYTARTVKNIYPHTPCEVVYPMISTHPSGRSSDRALVRIELETIEPTTVIVQVSRMEVGKGHALHFQALSKLRHLPDWVCWIVGGAHRQSEARYFGEIKELAAKLGIDERVYFLGERADVPRLLAAADIHCQPNIGPEGFGLTFIEALMARLPVVTTALGGAQEIINESCGFLVPPDDPQELALVLQRLITDRRLRTQLGAAGPARARQLCDAGIQLKHLSNLCHAIVQHAAV